MKKTLIKFFQHKNLMRDILYHIYEFLLYKLFKKVFTFDIKLNIQYDIAECMRQLQG